MDWRMWRIITFETSELYLHDHNITDHRKLTTTSQITKTGTHHHRPQSSQITGPQHHRSQKIDGHLGSGFSARNGLRARNGARHAPGIVSSELAWTAPSIAMRDSPAPANVSLFENKGLSALRLSHGLSRSLVQLSTIVL